MIPLPPTKHKKQNPSMKETPKRTTALPLVGPEASPYGSTLWKTLAPNGYERVKQVMF